MKKLHEVVSKPNRDVIENLLIAARALRTAYNYTHEEDTDGTWIDYVPSEDQSKIISLYKETLGTLQNLASAYGLEVKEGLTVFLRNKDGEYVDLSRE